MHFCSPILTRMEATGNSYHPTANAMSPTGPRPHAAPSGQSSWRTHVDVAISLTLMEQARHMT